MSEPILKIENLVVHYETRTGVAEAVNNVSFTVNPGETMGLVGETGAGKTTIALTIAGLLPQPGGHVVQGKVILDGKDISDLLKQKKRNKNNDKHFRKIRGEEVGLIFQDPMSALNPVYTVGEQIAEAIRLHNKISRAEAEERAEHMLETVGIPKERFKNYPHEFSGGMKQRIVIAIALACSPEVLIADEPTTALDVTIQAQVLALIRDLQQKMGMATLLITHDLGLVVKNCDDVAVMYAGQIVEYGTVEQIFGAGNHHPYTEGLFASIPNLYDEEQRLTPIPGMMPDPTALPEGCNFSPRCPHCMEVCRTAEAKEYVEDGHRIRCHLYGGMNDGIE